MQFNLCHCSLPYPQYQEIQLHVTVSSAAGYNVPVGVNCWLEPFHISNASWIVLVGDRESPYKCHLICICPLLLHSCQCCFVVAIAPILYVLVVKFTIFVHVPDWHWPPCQSGTWKKIGAGDSQIVTASATAWRWPGATATCPSGKKVIGGD